MTETATLKEKLENITPSKWILRKILSKNLCKMCKSRFDCQFNEENQEQFKGCALRAGVIEDIVKEMEPYF